MSEPNSLLFEDPASLAMREPNWMALFGSLLAPWQPSMTAASLSNLFSPTPLGRPRSAYTKQKLTLRLRGYIILYEASKVDTKSVIEDSCSGLIIIGPHNYYNIQ